MKLLTRPSKVFILACAAGLGAMGLAITFQSCGSVGSSSNGSTASPAGNKVLTWNDARSLYSPGPSLNYGNFGKAITTDADGYIDVVWAQTDTSTGDAKIVFAQSGDQGATWATSDLSAFAYYTQWPKIASTGEDIYVTWSAPPAAGQNLKVYVLHGIRSGSQVQWSAATTVSDTPVGHNATLSVVAADGSAVHIAWVDDRNSGVSEVYYTGSQDKGATWSTPVTLSPVDGFNSWTPALAVSGNSVHVSWTDSRYGATDCTTNLADCHENLFYRKSIDGGQTWQTETRLTCDATIYTWAPSVFVENNSVHIAYFEGNPYSPNRMNLYYLRSTHNGDDWNTCPSAQKLSFTYPNGESVYSAWRPNISVHNGTVHMVWWGELSTDYVSGHARVYYTRSIDGTNWDPPVSLTPPDGKTYRSYSPNISLSADGAKIYVVWEDHRDDTNIQNNDYQFYFRSSK